jgi:hypothetical protein
MQHLLAACLLLCDTAAACDAGVFWGEKHVGNLSAADLPVQDTIDTTMWPEAMRKHVFSSGGYVRAGDTWPAGANATSYSHTMTWEKMDPPLGGNVFVSLTLQEGCGSGYIGAQMHGGTDQMFTDWAIWDEGDYNTTVPLSKNCVRYDGEGHGTQCGVPPGHTWKMETPYTFNVTLVHGNASGAHFKSTITNGFTGEVIPLGEIWTAALDSSQNCSRLIVGGGGFQEIFSGGNFTNIASVEGPIFRGVAGHPADVMPTSFGNCYMHHSCYGKDGPPNCRNETCQHCGRPECVIPRETFISGRVDIPDAMIPPWDRHPDIVSSTECEIKDLTGLTGGVEPEYWGMPIMDDKMSRQEASKLCCGYCLADPDCKGAQLYGDRCSLRHVTNTSPPFSFPKDASLTVILPKRSYPAPPPSGIVI